MPVVKLYVGEVREIVASVHVAFVDPRTILRGAKSSWVNINVSADCVKYILDKSIYIFLILYF